MKLFIVSKKMSTRLSSETQFYSDFEPLTNPQLIKKTLQIQLNEIKYYYLKIFCLLCKSFTANVEVSYLVCIRLIMRFAFCREYTGNCVSKQNKKILLPVNTSEQIFSFYPFQETRTATLNHLLCLYIQLWCQSLRIVFETVNLLFKEFVYNDQELD